MRRAGPAVPNAQFLMGGSQLVRTGDRRAVRHRVRRSPAPGQVGAAGAVRRASASKGLRAHDPGGEALAGRGGRRRGRGGRMTAAFLLAAPRSFVNGWFNNFWLVLVIKAALVVIFFLSAPMV